MTLAEFKRKWARFSGKESAAYQEHFSDLCRLLGQPTDLTLPVATGIARRLLLEWWARSRRWCGRPAFLQAWLVGST